MDFGKRLLEAAKRGDTDEVRTLMSNGAPFTTDWVGLVSDIRSLLVCSMPKLLTFVLTCQLIN